MKGKGQPSCLESQPLPSVLLLLHNLCDCSTAVTRRVEAGLRNYGLASQTRTEQHPKHSSCLIPLVMQCGHSKCLRTRQTRSGPFGMASWRDGQRCVMAHMQSSIGVGEGSVDGGESGFKERRRLIRGGQANSICNIWAAWSRQVSPAPAQRALDGVRSHKAHHSCTVCTRSLQIVI